MDNRSVLVFSFKDTQVIMCKAGVPRSTVDIHKDVGDNAGMDFNLLNFHGQSVSYGV